MWRDDPECAAVEYARNIFRRVAGYANHGGDPGAQRGQTDLSGGFERKARMLHVDIEHVEASGLCDLGYLDATHQTHRHRGDDLVACQLLLHSVTDNIFGLHNCIS